MSSPSIQRPASPSLCKALDETFENAFAPPNSISNTDSLMSNCKMELETSIKHRKSLTFDEYPPDTKIAVPAALQKYNQVMQPFIQRMQRVSMDLAEVLYTSWHTIRNTNKSRKTKRIFYALVLPLTILGIAELSTRYILFLDIVLCGSILAVAGHFLPNQLTQPYLDYAEIKFGKWQDHVKDKIRRLQPELIEVRHHHLGWYTTNEIQAVYKDLQHTTLHLQQTKRQLARAQEQHTAEQLENNEWHDQALQQALEVQQTEHDRALERLQVEQNQGLQRVTREHAQAVSELQTIHARALKATQDEYEAVLQDEAVARSALNQSLQEQQDLYQTERHRNEVLETSLSLLGQEAERHTQTIRDLQEALSEQKRRHESETQNIRQDLQEVLSEQQRRHESETQNIRRDLQEVLSEQQCRHVSKTQKIRQTYETVVRTAEELRQQMNRDFQDESCRLRLHLVDQHIQRQHLERLVCQLLIVADETHSAEYWYGNVRAQDVKQGDDEFSIENMERKGQMLQTAVENAGKYVQALTTTIQRDHSLCLPIKTKLSYMQGEEDEDHAIHDIAAVNSSSVISVSSSLHDPESFFADSSAKCNYSSSLVPTPTTLMNPSCLLLMAAATLTVASSSSSSSSPPSTTPKGSNLPWWVSSFVGVLRSFQKKS